MDTTLAFSVRLLWTWTTTSLSGDATWHIVHTLVMHVRWCSPNASQRPRKKHARASFSRTNRNAGVNSSIFRRWQQQQHSSQGSNPLTALLFYSGVLYMFNRVSMPYGVVTPTTDSRFQGSTPKQTTQKNMAWRKRVTSCLQFWVKNVLTEGKSEV